ncbi:hypothetical protein [Planomonospora sp. ID82291]|uniref:hypothetical protein n=1 Tax=Planomonospora sp. ID82291 TaxID=2738136 RepID=UPI0018C3BE79|nr:hypothetical protein [Planomonospora sp. ID82291]MBG0812807.1 hypothetical protein [Planomonospora sp. ID82291]
MTNDTEPPFTFTTRTFASAAAPASGALDAGALDAGALDAGAFGADEVRVAVGSGADGPPEVFGLLGGRVTGGAEPVDRLTGAAVPVGPGVAGGRVRSRCSGSRERAVAIGVPTPAVDVSGAPTGSAAAPVRPFTALSGSILRSSTTSLRSTSRTPNQATHVASTVAPSHTAMNPTLCRMR